MKEKIYLGLDYLKYIADESKTWDEIIASLEGRAEYFRALKDLKLKLIEPVDNGHIHFEVPESMVEKYCRTFNCDKDDLLDMSEFEEEGEE